MFFKSEYYFVRGVPIQLGLTSLTVAKFCLRRICAHILGANGGVNPMDNLLFICKYAKRLSSEVLPQTGTLPARCNF